jgi:hypothetical protein
MGRKSREIALIKNDKIVKVGNAKDIAMAVNMSYTGIFQYIRENRTTKHGYSFKYANGNEVIHKENNLKHIDNDEEELDFFIPRSSAEKKEMLVQFINKHLAQRWRNVSYQTEKMERKFVNNLIKDL